MSEFKFASQRGRLFVWKYTEGTKQFPGWHFSADAEGCKSGIEICQELLSSQIRRRSLQVTLPTQEVLSVPHNRGGQARFIAPQRLQVELLGRHDSHPNIQWDNSGQTLRLMLDAAQLSALEGAFQDIGNGRGDYALDIGDKLLWVWWHL